jgi:hypothetical protein
LLAAAVVATAPPEAVPEIAREAGVSVEEARILYRAVLFGVAVGVGFGFISWLLAALLWRLLGLICRGRLLGRRRLPRPRLLPNRDVAPAAAALADVSEAEGKMDTPALTRT